MSKTPAFAYGSDFLIGAAIGSGSTALAAERGGADFLLAINAGRLRNMGAPSIACMLPVFDAASLTSDFAERELLPQCNVPVYLGVDVWGERFEPADAARRIRDAGYSGAVNFPSSMHFSKSMQHILSRFGRGIEQEVAQLKAVQDAGLSTMFYCATRTQARLAADAGIDMICLNLGWNVGGRLGHRPRASIEEVAASVLDIGRLIKRISPKTCFLLEGGPIETSEDLGRLLRLASVDGYVGGSTIERMPLEVSVADQIDRFRHAGRQVEALNRENAALVAWGRQFGFAGRSNVQLTFLAELKGFASTRGPVLLLGERGLDPVRCLNALASTRSARPAIYQVDVAGEDFPARARTLLFGNPDNPKRRPLLGDEDVDLLVIWAPERLPVGMQRRLARALNGGHFRPAGMRRSQEVHPRIVFVSETVTASAGTPSSVHGIEAELADALAGCILDMPPLSARAGDLMEIIEQVSERRHGRKLTRDTFTVDALRCLQAHTWPGNEAEVRSVVGALKLPTDRMPIPAEDVEPLLYRDSDGTFEGKSEKDRIVDALWRNGYHRGRTAAELGITRKTLYNKIKKFGLSE